jgi:hypothetical protein
MKRILTIFTLLSVGLALSALTSSRRQGTHEDMAKG